MAAPKTTIWNLEPHTEAKHDILKRYLQAWFPILSQGNFPELLFIDGFSGPGRYSKGEDGSPVIALLAALNQRDPIKARILFRFVEKKLDRAEFLEELINELKLPANFSTRVVSGEFEPFFEKVRQHYRESGRRFPATFAFIDPFGFSDSPFWIVKELMSHSNCEVLITFMYEEINRFLSLENQEDNFDKLMGTAEWRGCLSQPNSRSRNRCIHDLYITQLRTEASVQYVRSFEMRNQSGLVDYYLFYATNSFLGLKRMKEAMWKIDPSGEFSFSDATDPNQVVMFGGEPRYDLLQNDILEKFKGLTVSVGEIERFVVAETAFRETHYKTQILKPLESSAAPPFEVLDQELRSRPGTYPNPKIRLRFLS